MNIRWRMPLVAAAVIALAVTACGGGGQQGGGGNGGGGAEELPASARASSDDADGTTFPLRAGRYRLQVTAPDCERPTVAINSTDGAFSYEKQPSGYSTFINDMPAGEYTVTITSDCADWSIALDEF